MLERVEELALVTKSVTKAVVSQVKEYIEVAILTLKDELRDSIADMDRRLKAIPAGQKGDRGDVGPVGEKGESIIGPPGKDGLSIPGEKGEPGERGKDGESITGPIGPAGESIKGEAGEVGEQGPPGKDADPIDMEAVRGYITAEVAKAVAALPVPKDGRDGETGVKGEKGESITGPAGINGKDAEPIHPDTVRLMIIEEVGKAISAAPKAKDGKHGRDAAQIEILPSLDLAKSFPRGTFAKHLGGLWRAERATTPGEIEKSGWEIVVEGIAGYSLKQGDDVRTLAFETVLTSGARIYSTLSFPALIYRDVYRSGTEYSAGDVVNWDGCAWHCQAAATKSAPGASGTNPSDWKMIVKRGRDGKAGENGKGGPEGKPGRDGRDLTQLSADGTKH